MVAMRLLPASRMSRPWNAIARATRVGLVVALCAGASAGCGGDAEENEARLLLDRLEGMDEIDLGSRSERVAALLRMPFGSERVLAVRDLCGGMHDAMATAEVRGADARRLLEAMEGAPPEERGADAAAAVETALRESTEALDRVRDLRPQCDEKLAELRTRYASRSN